MATRDSFQVVKGFAASADLSAKQYLFMELGSGTIAAANAITDVPVGVLQNKPDAAGQMGEVCMIGFTKMVASAAITAGALIGTTTAGKAVALTVGTDTTQYILGRALTGASNDGDIIDVVINCANPARAA